jgi:hypothetical protein
MPDDLHALGKLVGLNLTSTGRELPPGRLFSCRSHRECGVVSIFVVNNEDDGIIHAGDEGDEDE